MTADQAALDNAIYERGRQDGIRQAQEIAAAQAPAEGDERAAFEAWTRQRHPVNGYSLDREPALDRSRSDIYVNNGTMCAWEGWQARAALAPNVQPKGAEDQAAHDNTIYERGRQDGLLQAREVAAAVSSNRFNISKEWLEEKLAKGDEFDASAGRPCDMPPGCNGTNCQGCGEQASQAPAPVDAELTEHQIERAWRLGFKAACDAELLNATEEWGYKGANVIEDVQGLAGVARGIRAHVAQQAQAPAVTHATVVQQALVALASAPQPVEHVLPFSNVCDCTQCRAVRATKSALAILRAASQPSVQPMGDSNG